MEQPAEHDAASPVQNDFEVGLDLEGKSYEDLEEMKRMIGGRFTPDISDTQGEELSRMLGEIESRQQVLREAGDEAAEKEAGKLLQELPPEEQEKVSWGLHNLNHLVEERSHRVIASGIGFFADSNLNSEQLSSRWIRAQHRSYLHSAEEARAKAAGAGKTVGASAKSTALTASKLVKWGRIISDLGTNHIASPLRYVMMAGAVVARSGDTFKEAVLEDEDVANKTRIADADAAADAAWELYEKAEAKGDASAETLQRAYLTELPADLINRLSVERPTPATAQERVQAAKYDDLEPGLVSKMVERFVRADIGAELGRLQNKLDAINSDPKLDATAKEARQQKELGKMSGRLMDYDRIIGDYGSVSLLAMAGRWAKTAGQTAVAAATLETVTIGAEKLFESLAHLLGHGETAASAVHAVAAKDALSHLNHAAHPGTAASAEHLLQPTAAAHVATAPEQLSSLEGGNIEAANADSLENAAAAGVHADTVHAAVASAQAHAEAAHAAIDSTQAHTETVHAAAAAHPSVDSTHTEAGAVHATTQLGADTSSHAETAHAVADSTQAHAEAVHAAAAQGADASSHAETAHAAASAGGSHEAVTHADSTGTQASHVETGTPATAPSAEAGQTAETIHKGGSVTSTIDRMVKEGKITAEQAHLARNNPLSGGIAHGQRVNIDKLWLSHEGDQIKFIPGENGGAPHFEVIEGGGGHLGLESDLDHHMQAAHHVAEASAAHQASDVDHSGLYNNETEGSGIIPESTSTFTSAADTASAHADIIQAGEASNHLEGTQELSSDNWTGTYHISYDSAGHPASFEFDPKIENIKGTEFLKNNEVFKNPADRNKLFSYTRTLVPQMHIYERLSQDPTHTAEAGFLRENIRNTFAAMRKAWGYKKFDMSKIPPYAQDIFKHRGILATIFDWQEAPQTK